MANLDINLLLKDCSGLEYDEKHHTDYCGRTSTSYTFFKIGDVGLPDYDVFLEIRSTATKGTIGKLVGIDIQTYGDKYPGDTNSASNEVLEYETVFIYEVEGRSQQGRIKYLYANLMKGTHKTKYVRNVKKHNKEKVKNPINKYKQEMKRGDWVIGVRDDKSLGIGRITRWTNHNVWAVRGEDLDDKSKEFRFISIGETFTMPDEKHVQLLTLAALKGWNGR